MIPLILMPVKVINNITNKFNGNIVIKAIPLNISVIKSISEDEESGHANIEMHNSITDSENTSIKTAIPFITFINHLNNMQLVDFAFYSYCMSYSDAVDNYIKKGIELSKQQEPNI